LLEAAEARASANWSGVSGLICIFRESLLYLQQSPAPVA